QAGRPVGIRAGRRRRCDNRFGQGEGRRDKSREEGGEKERREMTESEKTTSDSSAPTETPTKGKKSKKSRRMGQIIARGENKWLVRISLGLDESTGKRNYFNKTVHGTKKDADKFLTGMLRQIDLGEFVEPSTLTVNTFLDKWFDTMGSRVTEQTLRGYKYLASNHIRPVIGNRKLSSIHAWDIQQVYAEVEKKGRSACTVRHVYN